MATPGWNIRKHHSDRIYRKRLKRIKLHLYWRNFEDSNGDSISHPRWTDYINHKYYIHLKSYSTEKWDSRNKIKYSPNKGYWRDYLPKGNSYSMREKDKVFERKEIELGLDEFYSEYK